MKETYMAIDAHARRCVLGVMDESGRYLGDWQFPTTESELVRHVAAVKAPHKRLAVVRLVENDPARSARSSS
jgi:hypothetical protein